MEPDTECVCGHAYDEHRRSKRGAHECEIEDCECLMFEAAGEE